MGGFFMEETLRLLRETVRVAAGEGARAARLSADRGAEVACGEILEAARRRLAALSGELPEATVWDEGGDGGAERAVRSAVVGTIALSAALDACPEADADARALASRLLVVLRDVMDGVRVMVGKANSH